LFFFFLQGKAPKEIHAILTEILACFFPGRAQNSSAPLHERDFCEKKKTLKPGALQEISEKENEVNGTEALAYPLLKDRRSVYFLVVDWPKREISQVSRPFQNATYYRCIRK